MTPIRLMVPFKTRSPKTDASQSGNGVLTLVEDLSFREDSVDAVMIQATGLPEIKVESIPVMPLYSICIE